MLFEVSYRPFKGIKPGGHRCNLVSRNRLPDKASAVEVALEVEVAVEVASAVEVSRVALVAIPTALEVSLVYVCATQGIAVPPRMHDRNHSKG